MVETYLAALPAAEIDERPAWAAPAFAAAPSASLFALVSAALPRNILVIHWNTMVTVEGCDNRERGADVRAYDTIDVVASYS